MENEKKNFFGKGSSIGIGSLGAGKAIEFFKKGTIFGLIGGFIMAIIEAIFGILGKAEQEQKPDAEVEQEVNNYIQNATLAEYAKHSPSELLKDSNLKLTDEQIKNMQSLTKIYSVYGNDKGVESRYAFLLNEAVEFLETPRGKIKADNMVKLPFVKNQMNAIVDKDALYKLSPEDKQTIKEAIASGNLEKLTPEQKELYSLIRKVTLANVVVDEHSFLNVRETGTQNVNAPFYFYDKGSKGAFGQQQIMKETFAGTVHSKLGREGERESYSAEYAELVKILGRTPNLKDPNDVEAVLDVMIAKSANVKIGSDEFNAVKAKYNQDWVRDYLSGKMSMTDSGGNPSDYAKLKKLGDEVLVGSLFKYMGSEKGYVQFCLDLGYDKTATYNLLKTMQNQLGDSSIKNGEQAMNTFHNLLTSDKDSERALAGKIMVLNFGDNLGDRKLSPTEQLRVIDSVFKASGLEPNPRYGNDLQNGYLALANAARENPWVYDTMLKYRDWYGKSSAPKHFDEFIKHMFVNSFGSKYAEFDKMGVNMNGGYDGVKIPNPQKYSQNEINEAKVQIEQEERLVKQELNYAIFAQIPASRFLENMPKDGYTKDQLLSAINNQIKNYSENHYNVVGGVIDPKDNGQTFFDEKSRLESLRKSVETYFKDGTIYKNLSENALYAWDRVENKKEVANDKDILPFDNEVFEKFGKLRLPNKGTLGESWNSFLETIPSKEREEKPYKEISEAIGSNTNMKQLPIDSDKSVRFLDLMPLMNKRYDLALQNMVLDGTLKKEFDISFKMVNTDAINSLKNEELISQQKSFEKKSLDSNEQIIKKYENLDVDENGIKGLTKQIIKQRIVSSLKDGENLSVENINVLALTMLEKDPKSFQQINPFVFNDVCKDFKGLGLTPYPEDVMQKSIDDMIKSDKPEETFFMKAGLGKDLPQKDVEIMAKALKNVFDSGVWPFKSFDEFSKINFNDFKKAFTRELIVLADKDKSFVMDERTAKRLYEYGYIDQEEMYKLAHHNYNIKVKTEKGEHLMQTFINDVERREHGSGLGYVALKKEMQIFKEVEEAILPVKILAKDSLENKGLEVNEKNIKTELATILLNKADFLERFDRKDSGLDNVKEALKLCDKVTFKKLEQDLEKIASKVVAVNQDGSIASLTLYELLDYVNKDDSDKGIKLAYKSDVKPLEKNEALEEKLANNKQKSINQIEM